MIRPRRSRAPAPDAARHRRIRDPPLPAPGSHRHATDDDALDRRWRRACAPAGQRGLPAATAVVLPPGRAGGGSDARGGDPAGTARRRRPLRAALRRQPPQRHHEGPCGLGLRPCRRLGPGRRAQRLDRQARAALTHQARRRAGAEADRRQRRRAGGRRATGDRTGAPGDRRRDRDRLRAALQRRRHPAAGRGLRDPLRQEERAHLAEGLQAQDGGARGRASTSIRIQRALRDFTTRTHYPGTHRIEVLVNGQRLAEGAFELLAP